MAKQESVRIEQASHAGLVLCGLCDRGFRRVGGVHVGSQRMGMIPDSPCRRVFATRGDGGDNKRPWMAYVDGSPLRKLRSGTAGEARRFSSAEAAYKAARAEAPRMWHP